MYDKYEHRFDKFRKYFVIECNKKYLSPISLNAYIGRPIDTSILTYKCNDDERFCDQYTVTKLRALF